ncbi:MAG: shikimate kinase [Planctomycetota bacterium]|jgi:XRE family aerobic/anaerobic benzoate catabolism transcriptional regulator|nr:shikimate kinase [Planctomycetota bacterium]MDP6762160.1 shikimate kinase [Planctomycetota bacterium]MDP6988584.1 shikimate kinase [Planctomycetota bacterium]
MTDANPLLTLFARRLRAARQGAGLSVTELAERAGLSRRTLTEAEAGRANPSLIKLAALASGLGVPLPDLLDLPAAGRRGERLALVGLRGAGKSTVGRALARALEVPLVELDACVEELAGLTLAEIFDLHGERRFRELEAEALEEVLGRGERMVLATGGSIVASPRAFGRLLATCHTVWLRARPQEHFQRVLDQGDRRPMRHRPRAMEELCALLAAREPLYGRCDHEVDTSDRTVEEVTDEVRSRIAAWGGALAP